MFLMEIFELTCRMAAKGIKYYSGITYHTAKEVAEDCLRLVKTESSARLDAYCKHFS